MGSSESKKVSKKKIAFDRTIRSSQEFDVILIHVATTLGNNYFFEKDWSLTSCNRSCMTLMDELLKYYGVDKCRNDFFQKKQEYLTWTSFVREVLFPINQKEALRAFYVQFFLKQGGDHFVTFVSYKNYWVPFNSWQNAFTFIQWSNNIDYLTNAALSASRFSLFIDPLGFMGQIVEKMKNLPHSPKNWQAILKELFNAFQTGKIKAYGYI